MRFSLPLPLTFVRLRKFSETANPAQKAGELHAYHAGTLNRGSSLPVDYSMEGWMISWPRIGEMVTVLRTSRNAVATPGVFISTPVTAIPRDGEFHTANSRYSWVEADLETPPLESSPSADRE